ncbi:RnfABCDGE type electron transport complex subunit D [candidate division KSB3 bacterium]|uniref:Ion-translocating oxidoreductase complex subunit D n=1 Tax=candidate division KSB3 bacterium TaxID=2044937 RepID=A0A9D5JTU6_9BACT|nr:RnfABCDGE type electron transport complex subunit D [candidate division KSB3 bacterium]MBD3323980.1 RnfABCDGE type electron transport complex subunit D [candidate division KSB3 bacterium]
MEEQLFVISSAPHIESEETIPKIMYAVVIALIPAMLSAVIFFGYRAIFLLVTCSLTCIVTEYVIQRGRKQEITIHDGTALITGILLALVLPPGLSLLSAALGSVVAIGIGKQVFGGLGYNIFNPALVGRAFLQATYPVAMTTWVKPFFYLGETDAVTAATPLALMKFESQGTAYWKLLVGYIGGCLGETSVVAIVLGGAYLLYKEYIEWRIPAAYLGTVFVLGGLFWLEDSNAYPDPLFHLLAGGLMLGAVFMATDMVTSPMTPLGCWVFGIGAGILVIIIRLFGGLPEGVMYSILLMNAVTPLINRYTKPNVFGQRKGNES